MIIWLASFPRSGNTFVRMLLDRVYGVPSYSEYDEGQRNTHDPRPGFQLWVNPTPAPRLLEGLAGDDTPHFVKTHGPPLDDAPAICIIRDGRDVLVSYAHFYRCFERPQVQCSFDEQLYELVTAKDLCHSWSLNLNAWRARARSAPTVLVRYEALVKNPMATLGSCLRQLGIDLKPVGDSFPDFAELHSAWPAFFRKGKCGAWREEMSEPLHRLFWQHHGVMMEELGYLDDRPADFDGPAARMLMIEKLNAALVGSEVDRLARLQVIERLAAALEEARAARREKQTCIESPTGTARLWHCLTGYFATWGCGDTRAPIAAGP
jgi:hypothetical protein